MFEVNDTVIYNGKGVCTIQAVEERDFGGMKGVYYILKPVYNDSSTIYVPTDNQKLTAKMKKVLTREEVDNIIKSIPECETEWINEPNARREYYKSILEEADRSKILAVIRCIHQKQASKNKKDKKPHIFDIQFMQENEKIIIEEFAIALNIKPKEVGEYIDSVLKSN